jgi:hypothetical protein
VCRVSGACPRLGRVPASQRQAGFTARCCRSSSSPARTPPPPSPGWSVRSTTAGSVSAGRPASTGSPLLAGIILFGSGALLASLIPTSQARTADCWRAEPLSGWGCGRVGALSVGARSVGAAVGAEAALRAEAAVGLTQNAEHRAAQGRGHRCDPASGRPPARTDPGRRGPAQQTAADAVQNIRDEGASPAATAKCEISDADRSSNLLARCMTPDTGGTLEGRLAAVMTGWPADGSFAGPGPQIGVAGAGVVGCAATRGGRAVGGGVGVRDLLHGDFMTPV